MSKKYFQEHHTLSALFAQHPRTGISNSFRLILGKIIDHVSHCCYGCSKCLCHHSTWKFMGVHIRWSMSACRRVVGSQPIRLSAVVWTYFLSCKCNVSDSLTIWIRCGLSSDNGTCICDPAWMGENCSVLNLGESHRAYTGNISSCGPKIVTTELFWVHIASRQEQ